MHMPDPPAPTTEKDLDRALQATFPASDPLSATSHFTAAPTTDQVGATERSADHPGSVTLYRIVGEEQKGKPFATGSRSASRWTSDRVDAVYASDSPAGALLEFLANCEGEPPATAYLARANIPLDRITVVQGYPSGWNTLPHTADVQQIGDAWATSHQSLAAQVPSALVDETRTIILNPAHVDAPLLQGVHVTPLRIDDRLRRRAG